MVFRAQESDELDKKFNLVYEENIPENAFILDNKPKTVPCVFQIWIKGEIRYKVKSITTVRIY